MGPRMILRDSMSQIQIVLSLEPEARRVPSGEIVTQKTMSVWNFNRKGVEEKDDGSNSAKEGRCEVAVAVEYVGVGVDVFSGMEGPGAGVNAAC